MTRACLIGAVSSLSAASGMDLAGDGGTETLSVEGREILALSAPWVATPQWQGIYRFPSEQEGKTESHDGVTVIKRRHAGVHGEVSQTMAIGPGSVTVRYEFAFAEMEQAAHLQWVLRLESDTYSGTMVTAEADRPVPLRPLAGANIEALKTARLLLPAASLDLAVSAADGTWKLSDARHASWAKCYRLEYNREFRLGGKREGWIELTLVGESVGSILRPLTSGPETAVRGFPFRRGPIEDDLDAELGALAFWHTADGTAHRGETVGVFGVHYADGTAEGVPIRWEEAVSSPTDDPRNLQNGTLAPLPDGTPAWVTAWRNPRPEVAIQSIEARSAGAGWRLLAITGVSAGIDADRLSAVLVSLQADGALAEEVVLPLNGTWQFQADASSAARDIRVPSRWELLEGCRNVHIATYRRSFDLPSVLHGQRLLVRFDAVGEFCEVRINGLYAGNQLAGPLPVEFDITGLVGVPSQDNRIEVEVKDDTHFSVPKPSSDWRNRRHWVPHGIGGNNRKGLFQNVTLRGRPPVQIADVRVQTSVRKRELTVIYELFNSGGKALQVCLDGTVRPHGGGSVELTLPEATVELPGQVTTVATVSAEWETARLWQPNHPHLYELRSILSAEDGKRLQRTDTRFGFREVWFEGTSFYLNGVRCNLRGESPSYAQNAGPLEARDTTEDLVRKYLAANFNVLRFHAAPAPPHVYDVCDELGMLVIDESAIYSSWGMVMPEHPRWLPECRDHLARWVRRDRNHPSVVLWSAENESLNVNKLAQAQLVEFRKTIDEHDGTRPVIFDGDGTGEGVSPASVKHYVRTIADLENHGGKASGYGRDLRNDIYWAAEYRQTIPLGIGEFLFPANDAMRAKHREVCAMMGLQTRGYRYANWFDIRPYNPHYTGALSADGLKDGYKDAWDLIVKSFAAVAVFDREYDALGPFPDPPELRAGSRAIRTLIVYNDTFEDEAVTVMWHAEMDGARIAGAESDLRVELGDHTELEIAFTPSRPGNLTLTLASSKAGKECFRDTRAFSVVDARE